MQPPRAPERRRPRPFDGAGARASVGRLATAAEYEDFEDLWLSFERGVGRSGSVYLKLDARRRTAPRDRA